MAILKIARMGHPVLATPARAVADARHPEIRRLINDMVETMTDANGAGLAAPQVHVPLRIVVEGEKIERVARGFHARVVQHECDHLDGRLYTSRLSDMSRLIFESEIRHYQAAG